MGLAHQGQNRGDLFGVIEVLHHSVNGTHDPPSVLTQLQAPLHLQWVLHVLELAEVLLGRREVDKKPSRKNGHGTPSGGREQAERLKQSTEVLETTPRASNTARAGFLIQLPGSWGVQLPKNQQANAFPPGFPVCYQALQLDIHPQGRGKAERVLSGESTRACQMLHAHPHTSKHHSQPGPLPCPTGSLPAAAPEAAPLPRMRPPLTDQPHQSESSALSSRHCSSMPGAFPRGTGMPPAPSQPLCAAEDPLFCRIKSTPTKPS